MRLFRRRRGQLVDPLEREVFKFMPRNPPERGERVLVDGEPCEVVRCRVDWQGARWTIRELRVVEL